MNGTVRKKVDQNQPIRAIGNFKNAPTIPQHNMEKKASNIPFILIFRILRSRMNVDNRRPVKIMTTAIACIIVKDSLNNRSAINSEIAPQESDIEPANAGLINRQAWLNERVPTEEIKPSDSPKTKI